MRCLNRLLMLAVPAVCGATGGCLYGHTTARNEPLTASPSPFDADIPVPVGFELADQWSERRPDDSARFVRHRYGGRADKPGVRRFYQAQMPLMRWTCDRDTSRDGAISMYFRRGSESCTVRIEDNLADGWQTMVEVTINPIRDNELKEHQRR